MPRTATGKTLHKPHHRDVVHRRVAAEQGLDLGGVDVLAARDDHVAPTALRSPRPRSSAGARIGSPASSARARSRSWRTRRCPSPLPARGERGRPRFVLGAGTDTAAITPPPAPAGDRAARRRFGHRGRDPRLVQGSARRLQAPAHGLGNETVRGRLKPASRSLHQPRISASVTEAPSRGTIRRPPGGARRRGGGASRRDLGRARPRGDRAARRRFGRTRQRSPLPPHQPLLQLAVQGLARRRAGHRRVLQERRCTTSRWWGFPTRPGASASTR
jgi:hypothetical protein